MEAGLARLARQPGKRDEFILCLYSLRGRLSGFGGEKNWGGGGHEREPAVIPRYFLFHPLHAHIIISQ